MRDIDERQQRERDRELLRQRQKEITKKRKARNKELKDLINDLDD